ncbi:hypothetical protein GN958_ATG16025, partial [Phytophthora infestans]
ATTVRTVRQQAAQIPCQHLYALRNLKRSVVSSFVLAPPDASVTAFVLVSVLVKSLNSSVLASSPFSSHRPLVVDFNSLRSLSLARFVASLALSDCASRPGALVTLLGTGSPFVGSPSLSLPGDCSAKAVHVARHGSVGRGHLLTPAAHQIFVALPRRPNFRLECRVAL